MKKKTFPNPVVNDKRENVRIEGWDPKDTGQHTEWLTRSKNLIHYNNILTLPFVHRL